MIVKLIAKNRPYKMVYNGDLVTAYDIEITVDDIDLFLSLLSDSELSRVYESALVWENYELCDKCDKIKGLINK